MDLGYRVAIRRLGRLAILQLGITLERDVTFRVEASENVLEAIVWR